VHPAINPISASHLSPAAARTASPGPPKRRGLLRRVGGGVLDRVGDRAAAASAAQVEHLRDELDRTRAELRAELALLRAELEARDTKE
jgi:hypothetical protein